LTGNLDRAREGEKRIQRETAQDYGSSIGCGKSDPENTIAKEEKASIGKTSNRRYFRYRTGFVAKGFHNGVGKTGRRFKEEWNHLERGKKKKEWLVWWEGIN